MAKQINVNRSVNDPFYRYKMPRIIAKVEGKGNGIKTVIANMAEVAKALGRPPTYPTKYFGCELGAQTNFDLKNERYIVNGEHDANKLQDILDGFIRKFVLCPNCDNPETTLSVKTKGRSETIHSRCKACGNMFIIDQKQKLSTFILKNPPPLEGGETADKEPKEKRENSPTNGVEEGTQSQINGSGSGGDSFGEDGEDDDWAPVDTAPTEKLSAQVGKLVNDKDLDKPEDERLDMLHEFFVRAKKDGSIQDWKKMVNEAERLELKSKSPQLLAHVLFDDDGDVVGQITSYRQLLRRFCDDDTKAQRHLLGGIEQLVDEKKDQLLPKMAHIVKALYDNDICEEEIILAWGEKPSKKFVKKELVKEMIKVAQPVLTWLKEADEASDDEDGEEAVKFDDRAGARTTATATTAAEKDHKKETPKKEDAAKGGDEEDIDIDDI
jgi:translation initiation factor 5